MKFSFWTDDGLKTGLDWTQFVAKFGASKGPLYNTIGRFSTIWNRKLESSVKCRRDWTGLNLNWTLGKCHILVEGDLPIIPLKGLDILTCPQANNKVNNGVSHIQDLWYWNYQGFCGILSLVWGFWDQLAFRAKGKSHKLMELGERWDWRFNWIARLLSSRGMAKKFPSSLPKIQSWGLNVL